MHGREAYRRNSFLVLYSFYKNVLYVVVQFYFGFTSQFSGQPLYEKFIYQLYNITMTSLPIMWFAVFDFQHCRDREEVDFKQWETQESHDSRLLLRNPYLYLIGMRRECMSNKIMGQWIFYGLFHAALVYFFNMFPITDVVSSHGKTAGMWMAGHLVFGACVIVTNLVVLVRFNRFDWGAVGLVSLMILGFFVQFAFLSLFRTFAELYKTFADTITHPIIMLSLLLMVLVTLTLEMLYKFLQEMRIMKRNKLYLDPSQGKAVNLEDFSQPSSDLNNYPH